ncbi:MAG: AAA family ATPase [Myxococcota bacterium]
MYTEFFGLEEKPFALVPDPKYMFMGWSHREAFAHLLYGIEQGEGFIEIIGQVGTGKTTLCRTLLARLAPDMEIAYIFLPSQTEIELLSAINREFGLCARGSTRGELLDELNHFLLEKYAAGRRVLLVIDEAQNLGPAVLEQLRLLSNLETERGKLVQIVLIGQPELDENLSRGDLRQLRQRITVRWRLGPLERDEVAEYLEHRLRIAGLAGTSLFTPRAARTMYRVSRGIPRVVNAVADRALLAAYSRGQHSVDGGTVRRAFAELPASRRPRPAALPLPRAWVPGAVVAGALVAVVVASLVLLARTTLDRTALFGFSPRALPQVGARAPEQLAEGAFAARLEKQSRGAAAALRAVLASWGYEGSVPSDVEPNDLPRVVRELSSLRVFAAHSTRERLARLNVPSILELELAGGEPRYVALLRLDETSARVAVDGRELALAPAELVRSWSGRSFLLWRNFESLPALAPGMSGSAVRWLQARLSELGYLREGDASAEYDALTAGAIRRFQSAHALETTGEVGPETMIALYQHLDYGSPRLAADGESS